MPEPNDPRVFFAAERTLLAWVRTGLATMAFGFVVARFGLFLRMLTDAPIDPWQRMISTVIGVALILLGAGATAVAAWQLARFMRSLRATDLPPYFWLAFSVYFSYALAMIGAVLAVYLWATRHPN